MSDQPTYLVEWPAVEAGLRDLLDYLASNGAWSGLTIGEFLKQAEHAIRQRQQGQQQREGAHEWLPKD